MQRDSCGGILTLSGPLRLVLLGISVLWSQAYGSENVGRGGHAGSFLRMGLGARSLAMGGASAGMAVDGYTAFYNPAGLVFLKGRWFTSTLNSMALDRRLYYAGYSQPFSGKKGMLPGGFSAGWLCAGIDNIDARDFDGNPTDMLSAWEHSFFFSFALQPASPVAVGMSGKLLYSRFPDIANGSAVSAVGFGFDIGIMARPVSFLTIGITVRDLGSKYTWDTQNLYEQGTQKVDRFPRILSGGIAFCGFSERLLAGLDLVKIEFEPLKYRFGIQFEGYQGVFVRGGINNGLLAFGAGYRLTLEKMLSQLDYAFVPDPVAPRGNHIFTWSFVF
jgi:hypothetical protein